MEQINQANLDELYAQGWVNRIQMRELLEWCKEPVRKPPNIAFTEGTIRHLAYAIAMIEQASYQLGMETAARLCDVRADELANHERTRAYCQDHYGQKMAMQQKHTAQELALIIRNKLTETNIPWDIPTISETSSIQSERIKHGRTR